jgi:mono/diheme cytochrome c family protein
VVLLFTVPGSPLTPLGSAQDSTRSSRSGVYTADQGDRGQELYGNNCKSCHTTAFHTSPAFVGKWDGRPLFELFDYVRHLMPKSDPGSLSRREYILVTAYLLKLNGMPAGGTALPSDSVALSRIRLDLKQADTTRQR